MRPIKELLQVMLNNKELFTTGLCDWVVFLRAVKQLSEGEANELKRYIQRNRPRGIMAMCRTVELGGYYWPMGQLAPRLEWIHERIRLEELCTEVNF